MSEITQIKKRNGEIVDFEPEKISVAIKKAFQATVGRSDDTVIDTITAKVVADIAAGFVEAAPGVEDIQDAVEREIMEAGFYDVARAYIVYRYEHTKERQEEDQQRLAATIDKIESNALTVTKRSGNTEVFSIEKIANALAWAASGFDDIDIPALAHQVEREIYDGISTADISKALIMAARAWIERDPAYSDLAARLLHLKLYKEMGIDIEYHNPHLNPLPKGEEREKAPLPALSNQGRDIPLTPSPGATGEGGGEGNDSAFDQQYRAIFIQNIKKAVRIGKLDKRILKFDLPSLAQKLVPERDNLLKYLGAQTLYDRYYIQIPETKEILETPQMLWMRVAMGLAINEAEKEKWAAKFYEVMSTLRYVPSTPTLFHAGTNHPQLSSCYLNTVEDDLTHIFKVIGDNAQLSKWSGGIGTDWTYLRGTGALIRGTGVESQGVIPFLKVANDATHAINRSGRRRGAACVYLEVWHYDIESFLELRKNTGDERRRTHDIDTANWIPDLFMKRVRDNGGWTLFSPDEVRDLHDLYGSAFEKRYQEYEEMARTGQIKLFKVLPAKDIWKKMLAMLFETGHPWLTWKDPANVRSPQDHVGVIHNSNLCTEITLNTSAKETAVCNLGSVNLPRHLKRIHKWTTPLHQGYAGQANNTKDEDHNPHPRLLPEGEGMKQAPSPGAMGEGWGEDNDGINGYELDEELIRDTVTTAMRMLDNVIDINFYPTVEAKNSNLKHRPVGLGLMGFQDILYSLNINFDSEEAVELADQTQEMIAYSAYLASSKLAKERGAYASYDGSKWDRGILPQDTLDLLEKERGEVIPVDRKARLDWTKVRASIRKHGIRNSNCLAIAPTATISNIAGSVPTIEPIYKNIYVKSNASGDFIVINPYLVDELKRLGLWNQTMLTKIKYNDGSIARIAEIPSSIREKYKEVFEIEAKWLIDAAARRGKWIDQSQSLNIYFNGTSGGKLSDIYFDAWAKGLKTTYYLRTLAKSQVEKSTVSTTEFGATHKREMNAPQMDNRSTDGRQQTPRSVISARLPDGQAGVMPKVDKSLSDITKRGSLRAPRVRDLLGVRMPKAIGPDTFNNVIIGHRDLDSKNIARDDNQKVQTSTVSAPEVSTTLQLCRIDDPNCEACQ